MRTAALRALWGGQGARRTAAAAPASPAALSSWPRPAAAGAAPSASGSLLGGASVPLSSSDTTLFLHLRQETEREQARFTQEQEQGHHPTDVNKRRTGKIPKPFNSKSEDTLQNLLIDFTYNSVLWGGGRNYTG